PPRGTCYATSRELKGNHSRARRSPVLFFNKPGKRPLCARGQFAVPPFLHTTEVEIFYPPHLLLLLCPEEWVGPAVSWLVVLHVLLAGLLMFAYARHRGLSEPGALVAAVGFMFAGRGMMHLLGGGHYITIGLAWLPLVLLC